MPQWPGKCAKSASTCFPASQQDWNSQLLLFVQQNFLQAQRLPAALANQDTPEARQETVQRCFAGVVVGVECLGPICCSRFVFCSSFHSRAASGMAQLDLKASNSAGNASDKSSKSDQKRNLDSKSDTAADKDAKSAAEDASDEKMADVEEGEEEEFEETSGESRVAITTRTEGIFHPCRACRSLRSSAANVPVLQEELRRAAAVSGPHAQNARLLHSLCVTRLLVQLNSLRFASFLSAFLHSRQHSAHAVIEYLVDLEGLLEYLGAKIFEQAHSHHVCAREIGRAHV